MISGKQPATRISIVSNQQFLRQSLGSVVALTFGPPPQFDSLPSFASSLSDKLDERLVIVIRSSTKGLTAELDALTADFPNIKLVVFADEPLSVDVNLLHRRNLRGVLGFSMPPDMIMSALHLIEDGHVVLPHSALGQMMTPGDPERAPGGPGVNGHAGDASTAAIGRLSRREREVLRLIADGYSNKKIAYLLQITDTTVRIHMRSILRKLGAENRTQAAILAIKAGLADG